MRSCVFSGTFDPPTLGHKSVVDECLKMFDKVIIAVMVNPKKTPFFTLEERLEMLRLMYGNNKNVEVITFTGTAVELMKFTGATAYVRGIRNSTDLDYENNDFYMSRKLDENMTCIYLPCPQELLHISSTGVRNSVKFSTPISEYVTEEVENYIKKIKAE